MSDDFEDRPPSGSWAADDPTAMWNQDSLREAGVTFDGETDFTPASGAATAPENPAMSSIQIDLGASSPSDHPPPSNASGQMSPKLLALTGVLAVALAVAVFMLVKLLRS